MLKAQLNLESLDGRYVPDATQPLATDPPPVVDTLPPTVTPPTPQPYVDDDTPDDMPKAEDKPQQLSLAEADAEYRNLDKRLDEIDRIIADLTKERAKFKADFETIYRAVAAAKPAYDAAKQKFQAATEALAKFERENPKWMDDPFKVQDHKPLEAAKKLAEAEFNAAKSVYDPVVALAYNLKQRIDAIDQGIANLQAEATLIRARQREMSRNTEKSLPNFATPAIPKAAVPTIDDGFKDWTKPLTGTPDLKAPAPTK